MAVTATVVDRNLKLKLEEGTQSVSMIRADATDDAILSLGQAVGTLLRNQPTATILEEKAALIMA